MRSGAGATVGIVAELVNMHSSLGRCIVALDLVVDGGGGVLVRLLKGDGTLDLAATADDCDCTDILSAFSCECLNEGCHVEF